MLIVLALLVLVLSLSVPSILVTLDRRQFNEVREQILTYMTMVRAEAQLSGEVLAVYYEPAGFAGQNADAWDDPVGFGGLTPRDVPAPRLDPAIERPSQLVARPYELFADASSRSTTAGSGSRTQSGESGSFTRRSTLRLGDAFRLSRSLPADWLDSAAFNPSEQTLLRDDADSSQLILAVFFPDGTAAGSSERLYLVHDEGNVAELVINRWTGQADLRVLTRDVVDEPVEPDSQDIDDPFSEEMLSPPPPGGAGDVQGGGP